MCETMNPGPFLIIRNTFPTIFKHLLHSAILKSENTKTLFLLAFTYKNPNNTINHHCYHPCIIIHHHCIFICCFAFNIIVISFSHLMFDNPLLRSGHKAIFLFAGNLEKDKEIKYPLLIPREFDIKPSSHPRGEKLPLLHTLHLEAQPNPYIIFLSGYQECLLA